MHSLWVAHLHSMISFDVHGNAENQASDYDCLIAIGNALIQNYCLLLLAMSCRKIYNPLKYDNALLMYQRVGRLSMYNNMDARIT